MNDFFKIFNVKNSYTSLSYMWHKLYMTSNGWQDVTDDEYQAIVNELKDFKGSFNKLINYYNGTQYILVLYIYKYTDDTSHPLYRTELLVDDSGIINYGDYSFNLNKLRAIKYRKVSENVNNINLLHHRITFSNPTLWKDNMTIRAYIYKTTLRD